jgi:hypothetical protein
MNTVTTPKISKLVSHAQYITWYVGVENAILAAGAYTSLEAVVTEPVRPINTGRLVVSATYLWVHVADVAYYRSWKDKNEQDRGSLFQNVFNGLRMKL